jgi:hypothetical protein
MVDADMEAVGMEPIGEGLKIIEENFTLWHRWESSVTALINNNANRFD